MRTRPAYRALALAALLPMAAFAQDDSDGTFLERTLERSLSGDGIDVRVVGFRGALSSEATLERLTVADTEGVWLSLEDVVLDWRRAALLRGRLDVTALRAGAITLARLPVGGEGGDDLPTPESSGFRLPELPVSVEIDQVVSPSITIGEPVLGVAAEFSLEGSVNLADGEGAGTLDIQRIDGGAGELRLDAGFSNATAVLEISLNLTEAPGGIFATVVGLPGAPSVDLVVDGDGPLDSFAASLSLSTDGVERLAGDVGIGATDDGAPQSDALPFRATLAGDVAPLFLPDYAEFFGPRIALDLSGVRQRDGATRFERFRLSARAIDLDGRLSLGADGVPRAFALSGRIASGDGQTVLLPIPGEPIRVGSIDLQAGFDARDGERWTADLSIADFERAGISMRALDLDGSGTIPAPGTPDAEKVYTADLSFGAEALDLGDPAAEEAIGEAVEGQLSVRRAGTSPLDVRTLAIEGETYRLEASGTLDIADRDLAIDGRLVVEADALSEFAGVAGRPLSGRAAVTVDGRGSLLGGDVALVVSGTTEDLVVGVREIDAVLAGRTDLDVSVSRGADGIAVERARLAAPSGRIAASGSLRSDGSDVALTASLVDGSRVLPGLEGPVEMAVNISNVADIWSAEARIDGAAITGTANGSLDVGGDVAFVEGALDVSTPAIDPFGPLLERPELSGALTARVAGRASADLTSFDLSLSVDAMGLTTGIEALDGALGGALALEAEAKRDQAGIMIDRLTLETASTTARLAGRIDGLAGPLLPPASVALFGETPPRFDGSLDIASDDLARLAPLAGPGLSGDLSASLVGGVTSDLSQMDLRMEIGADRLATGREDIDPLLSGGLALTVSAERTDGGPLTLDRLDLRSDAIDATLSGRLSGLPRALLPDPDAVLEVRPSPTFAGDLDVETVRLGRFAALAALPGLTGTATATASGRIVADLSQAELDLDATLDDFATGVTAADDYVGGRVALDAELRLVEGTVALDTLDLSTPQVTVTGEGAFGRYGGRVSADGVLAEVGRIVPGLRGPLTLSAAAESATGERWRVRANADGPAGLTLAGDGTVSGDGRDLDVEVRGSAPLALANQFIAPRNVEGDARFDLTVNGPPSLGSLAGQVTIAGARFVAPTLNFVLDDLGGTIGLGSARATIDLRAATQGGGGVSVSGPIGLSRPFAADMRVVLQDARYSDPELFETTLDGQIALSGPLTGGARITGDIALGATEVRVPAGATGGAAPIPDIVHLGEPPSVRQTRGRAGLLDLDDESGGSGPDFGLDIGIRAPEQIFIRGRGLDAEVGGGIRIRGTTRNVIPSGRFELLRGRLDILGKRLTLDEGAVTLEGSLDPFLRLVAAAEAGDFDIFVVVSGPASAPQIQFLSEPELPEDEVVARLLFDRGIQNLSPLQAAQLASAVATLTGRGGEGLIGGLREGFGLDDLDVTSDGDGNVGVRAGKYLSDNVYTDIVVNSDGSTEIELNLDITRSLSVTGSVDNEGETGIGIFFERDY